MMTDDLGETEGRLQPVLDRVAMAHSRSRVTHTVARMEAVGYVTRGTTPEDGRGVVATMTETGYELLREAAPRHVEGVRSYLVDQVYETDFAALGRAMDAVADHLVSGHPEMDIRGGATS